MAFTVDYFYLQPSDATARYVLMTGTPKDTSNVALDVVGGTAQTLLTSDSTKDFYCAADSTRYRVGWDNTMYSLYSQLASFDRLRVIYDRS